MALLVFFIVLWTADAACASGSGASGSFHSRGEESLVPPTNPEYRNIVDLEMRMRKELEDEKSKAWKDYEGGIKEDTKDFLGER